MSGVLTAAASVLRVNGTASLTLTGGAYAANGLSYTATISGGTGTGLTITNANGLVLSSGGLRRLITGQSIVGTTLTITFGFPIGAGATSNTISTNSGATSTISDSGGNTLQTQTNLTITNNSTVTVTGFNSSATEFWFQGGFTTTASGGRNLYAPQPTTSGFAVGFTGTYVALVCQSNSAFAVELDGGGASNITPNVTNTVVALPVVAGVADSLHQLFITGGQFWDSGTGATTQGTILVAGSAPAISYPTGDRGTINWFDGTQFSTYAELNPAPLFTTNTNLAGHTYKQMQDSESCRFTSDSNFIIWWAFRSVAGARTYVVYQDGVEIASYAIPTTPASTYQRNILATGLSGTHEYEILCITPITYRTTAVWYEGYVELNNSGIISTLHPARQIEAFYGDSITAVSSATPPITDTRLADMWPACQAANRVPAINGTVGGKVHTAGRDGTGVIPTNCDRLHIRYGVNDLPDLGTGTGQTNFQNSYATMINNARTRIGAGKPIYCYQPQPVAAGTNRALAGTLIQAAIVASGDANSTYISTDNWYPTTTTYLPDGTHPNALCYSIYANRDIPILSALSISLTAPASSPAGAPSGNGTVTLSNGATFTGDQTITLTSSNITDTIAPSVGSSGVGSVVVTPANGATSFTYTINRATPGNSTITPTAGQAAWTMPSAVVYTAS